MQLTLLGVSRVVIFRSTTMCKGVSRSLVFIKCALRHHSLGRASFDLTPSTLLFSLTSMWWGVRSVTVRWPLHHNHLTTRIIESFSTSISSSGLCHPRCCGRPHTSRVSVCCPATNLCVSARSSLAWTATLSIPQDTIVVDICSNLARIDHTIYLYKL